MSTPKSMPIPTFVINIKDRIDRRHHIVSQFAGREEFDIKVVEAIEDKNGALGLWKSICLILREMTLPEWDYIVICEDDHKFTDFYTFETLECCIHEARNLQLDLICGGVSCLRSVFKITGHLHWTECFTGFQFTVLFRGMFEKILESEFNSFDAADLKISSMSRRISVIYPFISVQQNFGYSDVTENNNFINVEGLFGSCSSAIDYLLQGESHYKMVLDRIGSFNIDDYDSLTIPAYVSLNHNVPELIDKVFSTMTFSIRHLFEINSLSQFQRIDNFKSIVSDALKCDEHVFFYCEKYDIQLSSIDKQLLFESITLAYYLGADMLIGGPGGFEHVVPVTKNIFWIDKIASFDFVFVFKRLYDKLLTKAESPQTLYGLLSSSSTNKLGIYLPVHSSDMKGEVEASIQTYTTKDQSRIEMVLADFETLSSLRFTKLG